MKMECCVYSLESPHRGDSYDYTQYTIILKMIKKTPYTIPLQKHAYSTILKISPQETESLQVKILIFFIFLLKT